MVSGILAKADKAGAIIGFAVGHPNGWSDTQSIIENLMRGNVHMPDLLSGLQSWAGENDAKMSIMMYILGYVIDELNLPFVGKYAPAMKKFAVGYATGSVANKILWMATH